MDHPPTAMWERAGALAAYEDVIRDLSHIGHEEAWRRIERLTEAQGQIVIRLISRAALAALDACSS